jgi:hypothetical protein
MSNHPVNMCARRAFRQKNPARLRRTRASFSANCELSDRTPSQKLPLQAIHLERYLKDWFHSPRIPTLLLALDAITADSSSLTAIVVKVSTPQLPSLRRADDIFPCKLHITNLRSHSLELNRV